MWQFTVVIVVAAMLEAAPEPDGVRLAGHWYEALVQRATRGASKRLSVPACAAVVDEFRDEAGRPLGQRLGELEMDASSYVRMILVYDGSNERACRQPRVYAFTTPGSRVVRACPSLGRLARIDPERAEAVVIHEMLHSLGLAEDWPSGQDITAVVEGRCRGAAAAVPSLQAGDQLLGR